MSLEIAKKRKIVRTKVSDKRSQSQDEIPGQLEESIQAPGIITAISLKNVFCHDLLIVSNFSEKINLLQGRNGSGKSSVVAAIIAGLGGSSKSTDRGNSLKNLIQNGQSSAVIEIHLKNKGCFAYKPEIYGDSLKIERKIVASGANSYKIKTANGEVVSTKKDDLARILDWFNIQVDNPLLILSQERARTFLSSTDPKDHFKFFMSATYLQKVCDDICEIRTNIDYASNLLKIKEENLEVIFKELQHWIKKVELINTLEGKREKIAAFRNELAWAEVRDAEKSLEEKRGEKLSGETKMEHFISKISRSNMKKNELDEKKKTVDGDLVALVGRSKECELQRKKLADSLQDIKQRHRTEVHKKKAYELEVCEKQRDINILRKTLERNNDEAKSLWEEENKRISQLKNEILVKIKRTKDCTQTEDVQLTHFQDNLRREEEDCQHSLLQENAFKRRLESLHKERHAKKSENNSMSIYGQYMPRLLEEIEIAYSRKDFCDKPIGPMGRHIKIKDMNWAHIAEMVIGNLMTAFQVSNQDDLYTLQDMCSRIIPDGVSKPSIIMSPFRNQVHDFYKFMTGTEKYCSLWSLLEVNNIHVANTLLDQRSCERMLLIPTAEEAAAILSDKSRVPKYCTKAYTLKGDTYFPDPNYKIYSGMDGRRVRYLQVSLEDQIKDLEVNITSTEKAVAELRSERTQKEQQVYRLREEIGNSTRKLKQYQSELNVYNRENRDLQNREVPPPPDVYQLQSDLQEHEEQKQAAQVKVNEIELSLQQTVAELREQQRLCEASQKESQEIDCLSDRLKRQLDEVMQGWSTAKKELQAYSRAKTELEESLNKVDLSVKEVEKNFQRILRVATQLQSERINTRRSVVDIEKNLHTLELAVRNAEEEHGDAITIINTQKEKKDRYEKIKNEITDQINLISKLKMSVGKRCKTFRYLKRLYVLLLNSSFETHIGKRNLSGHISVDYEAETLHIMMMNATGSAKPSTQNYKTMKMMSGGERSFATVSFILALWSLVSSPIRIMDEFDVFMDVIAKKQCLDMIIESASTTAQYILVSPQEYKLSSDDVTALRMPDPERRRQVDREDD